MNIGIWELLVLLLVVLVVFGAGKLPSVMGDVGRGIRQFKAGLKDDEGPAASPAAITARSAMPMPAGQAETAGTAAKGAP